MTARRLSSGGRIDRNKPIRFTFDGMPISGFSGDTIASALIASDVMLAGRSFKLHRPRGIVGSGYDDSVMLDRLSPDPVANQLAAVAEIREGAAYRSVSTWPNARRDFGQVAQWFARLLPAGFYYKTFKRPTWHLFEPFIRGAAGLGRVPDEAWEPNSESRFGDCDVLVVGAGSAGLAAALTAARAGLRVILADDGASPGGRLVADGIEEGGWIARTIAELIANASVTFLPRSTVWGYHEHNFLTLIEREPADAPDLDFRNWKIRARRVVIAAGAYERPIPFAGSDKPGVMLASAVRNLINRHATLPGQSAVVFSNNDSACLTAVVLRKAGANVTLVDTRAALSKSSRTAMTEIGVRVEAGALVAKAHGRLRVEAVDIHHADGSSRRIDCDLVAVSGGWNPAFHLASQTREARSVWRDDLATFVAEHRSESFRLVGACTGEFDASACARQGALAGEAVAKALGKPSTPADLPSLDDPFVARSVQALWFVPPRKARDKVIIDLTGDVATSDLGLALREGYDSIELVKRYTTAGMGVDQGKSGNVNVIGVVGALTGQATQAVGTTTFRPPFAPIEFGAIAGARSGARLYPWRHTSLSQWHIDRGAVMYEAGLRWQRPGYYPRAGENWQAAASREARAVRERVGVYDGSPLGKFQLKGPDVPALLDLLYISDFRKLAVGRGKYGVTMSDDGLIFDDGVTFRLSEDRWLLHSSTGAADKTHALLEQILQIHRPDWRVSVIPMTSQWANATLCGPKARDVLAAMKPDFDIGPKALPFMGMAKGRIGEIPVRVFRVSWTGELSFELNTPARHAIALWDAVMQAGNAFDIEPVGSEANHILRVEAGYISTGHEVDGTSDAHDLGLGPLVSRTKPDFLGKRSMEIRRRLDPTRYEMVGFLPESATELVPEGAPITPGGARTDQEGFVSACVMSVVHNRPVALGLLRNGHARLGDTVHARVRESIIPMQVVAPVFHDADRARVKS